MKVRRTQLQLIKAVENAHVSGKLTTGVWVKTVVNRKIAREAPFEVCQVCAVGACFMDLVEPLRAKHAPEYGNPYLMGPDDFLSDIPDASQLIEEGAGATIGTQGFKQDIFDKLVAKKLWMAALCHAFEGAIASDKARNYEQDENGNKILNILNIEEGVKKVKEVIRAHFPKTITIDINGFTPKPNVQIVKERKKKVIEAYEP
jgi:hypothetical protein